VRLVKRKDEERVGGVREEGSEKREGSAQSHTIRKTLD
jgi:hypothetical protein